MKRCHALHIDDRPLATALYHGAMTYTFWHSGILIGQSDLEEDFDSDRQRAGAFHPTPYGLEIFPRLSGIFAAGNALRTHLDENGICEDDLTPEEIEELLDSTPGGQQLIDVGRTLSEVEARTDDGTRLEFASIAFSDLLELRRFAHELQTGGSDGFEPPPPDVPRYFVSGTLLEDVTSPRHRS
jgi:hypothetical protein